MKICPHCKAWDNPDDATYCYKCGGSPLKPYRRRYPDLSALQISQAIQPPKNRAPLIASTLLTILLLSLILLLQYIHRNPLSPPELALCSKSQTALINLGPVVEGENTDVTTPFNLCTHGSGDLSWSSQWDTQRADWLRLEQTGHIRTPAFQQISIKASAATLKAGSYATTVTFTTLHDQGSKGTIKLRVILRVLPKSLHSCLKTDVQSLTFMGIAGQTPPSSQLVNIINCGDSGNWLASPTTTDGTSWLNLSSTGGYVNNNEEQKLVASIASAKLEAGTYSGKITASRGSSTIQIPITLDLQAPSIAPTVTSVPSVPPKPCITLNSPTLAFAVQQGSTNPGGQTFVVTNACQDAGQIALQVTTGDGGTWLNAQGDGPLTPLNHQVVSVGVNIQDLTPAQYTGQILVTLQDANGAKASQTVHVQLTVSQMPQPCITANQTSFAFTANTQGGAPPDQPIIITSCGDTGMVTTDAGNGGESWLSATGEGPLAANGQITIDLSVAPKGWSAGQYEQTFTVGLTDANKVVYSVGIDVQLTLTGPCIRADPLSFTAEEGGANPSSQNLALADCGDDGGLITTTATNTDDGEGWLNAASSVQLAANGQAGLSIDISIQDLSADTYSGVISLTLQDINGYTFVLAAPITLTIDPPCGTDLQPPSANLQATVGLSASLSQNFTVTNCGNSGNVVITTSPNSNPLPLQLFEHGQVTFTLTVRQLSPGQYQYIVYAQITDSYGAIATATATLTIQITAESPR